MGPSNGFKDRLHPDRLGNICEYTADRHKRDLEEIVKNIGANKVILIGQSWGAILATLFLADNPDKVKRLIITGTGPLLPVRGELAAIKAPDSLGLIAPPFSNKEANKRTQNIRSKATTFWALTFGKKLATDKEADEFQTFLNNELNHATVCDPSKVIKAEGGGGFYVQVMTVNSFKGLRDPRPKLRNSKIRVLVMKG